MGYGELPSTERGMRGRSQLSTPRIRDNGTRPSRPSGGAGHFRLAQRRPHSLVADAELRGQRAQAPGPGEGTDRRLLGGRQLAGATGVAAGSRAVMPRWGGPTRDINGGRPEIGHRDADRASGTEKVLNVLNRIPSLPPARVEA